jgi:4-diphosphocytidyl-2-C-methyl-D-erythritol kinase
VSEAVLTRRAHAKLNVFLRVLGRRDDGFHDLETVVLPLSLHDVVTAEATADPLEVRMVLHGAAPFDALEQRDNIVTAAAERLAATAFAADRHPGVRVTVGKSIPFAAGLGGGSADAAAALLALNDLWGCGLDADRLASVAAQVGSDVPAMLAGEPVLARGRGDRLVPVHAATTWWVLRPFAFGVSAPDAYSWWDDAPVTGHDPGVLIAALETGDVELLGPSIYNDLQPGVVARHAEIGEVIGAFLDAGALGAVMSGSGPTVAAIARHFGHADALAAAVPGSIVVSGPPAPASGIA